MSSYTPFPSASTQDREENQFWLDRELSLIENALEDKREMKRGELGDLLGCKYWGPRRFAPPSRRGSSRAASSASAAGATGRAGSAR